MAVGINEFYKGRHIFMTGGTGFMGKTLIEKLVRSCPGIGNIYILVRNRKGKDIKSRVQELLESSLFDTIKKEKPGLIESKIFPVFGDMRMLKMGLSDSDHNMLVENVSVVFHVAATVRFDEPFNDAVIMNVRGTYEVIQLAKQMKNLMVFLHVSTSYCNCTRIYVEEKIYEPPFTWRDAITMAENMDEKTVNVVTTKFLGRFPNTYTLTKLLAEHICNDEKDNLPIVIIRPTIVMSTIKEPISGWLDNFNGPVGLLMAAGKGFVRILLSDRNALPDYVPVDLAIKAIIVAAWHRAIQNCSEKEVLPIYHCATGLKSVSNGQLLEKGLTYALQNPYDELIWRPDCEVTKCFSYFYLLIMIKQVFPSFVIDKIFKITRKKPRNFLDLQRKIYLSTKALTPFLTLSWTFKNHKFLALLKEISEEELEDFDYDIENLDIIKYIKDSNIGIQKYLLKSDPSKVNEARRNLNKFIILDRLTKTVFYTTILWFLLKSEIPTIYFRKLGLLHE